MVVFSTICHVKWRVLQKVSHTHSSNPLTFYRTGVSCAALVGSVSGSGITQEMKTCALYFNLHSLCDADGASTPLDWGNLIGRFLFHGLAHREINCNPAVVDPAPPENGEARPIETNNTMDAKGSRYADMQGLHVRYDNCRKTETVYSPLTATVAKATENTLGTQSDPSRTVESECVAGNCC